MKKLLLGLVAVALSTSAFAFDKKITAGVETIHGNHGGITSFKAGTVVENDIMIGALFGFANGTEQMFVGPFVQKNLYRNDIFRAYGEVQAGLIKFVKSGAMVSALGGVGVTPVKTFPFEITLSFGLVLDTANETKLTTVQNDLGNLGFSYTF